MKQIRQDIALWMRKNKKITLTDAYAIIDYENELPVMIEEDKQRGRAHDIESMAMHLLKNDEGRYQLELLTNQSI
jgi:hypothetical protein